jgi:hypothetical protein
MAHDEAQETAAPPRRRGGPATDPAMPLVLFGGGALASLALSRPWLLWLGLAGVAGYALSGSV